MSLPPMSSHELPRVRLGDRIGIDGNGFQQLGRALLGPPGLQAGDGFQTLGRGASGS
jgi:hypothetical protein